VTEAAETVKPAEGTEVAQETSPAELILLPPETLRFRKEDGRLQVLGQGDDDWREVSLARLFPLTEPEKWVAVLDKDGKEIGVLEDFKGMPHESLLLVREHLERRYLVPEILHITSCRTRSDLVEWNVETNRGDITILTRNLRDNVQRPFPNRLALTDVEGNRYDIPDIEALDPISRRLLEERL
jgi:hypothetical protein